MDNVRGEQTCGACELPLDPNGNNYISGMCWRSFKLEELARGGSGGGGGRREDEERLAAAEVEDSETTIVLVG